MAFFLQAWSERGRKQYWIENPGVQAERRVLGIAYVIRRKYRKRTNFRTSLIEPKVLLNAALRYGILGTPNMPMLTEQPQTRVQARNRDKRSSIRFPIVREVRFKRLSIRNSSEIGRGQTIDISSKGVYFTSDAALSVGERLELSINWPAQLDQKCPLQLVTLGRVVRSDNARYAMAIERYEFRTMRTSQH